MAKKIRVGLIGCGGIMRPHISGYLSIQDKAEIVAINEISQDNITKTKEQIGKEMQVYSDWNDMLKKEQLDAVDICLPHHLHKPAIIDAARAGKHIICEKPLCLNMKEAEEIVSEVNKAGITYMSAHNQLFCPAVQEAKKLFEEGKIGKLFYIRTQDCFYAAFFVGAREKMGWRGDVEKQGGGELIDTGYHPSYLLLYLAGSKVKEVKSVTNTFVLDMDAEDTALVIANFENGAIGEVLTSWAMPKCYGQHQFHLIGEKGEIFGSGTHLYYLPRDSKEPEHKELSSQKGDIQTEVEHFVDCLLQNKQPVATLQQGVDVLEFILKATNRA